MTSKIAVLIASGAYISPEIAAEFGRIPPAFLPIGNRRLYVRQLEEIKRKLPDAPVYISLPDDFDLDSWDQEVFDAAGVKIVRTSSDLSLGASLTHVILTAGIIDSEIRLLHGDTLLLDYPFEETDAFSAGKTQTYYPWADYAYEGGRLSIVDLEADSGERERTVLSGAFAFADTPLFLRTLAQAKNNFVRAVELYSHTRAMSEIQTGRWLDFGHLHTYFQSRREITTERHFNRLETNEQFFVKSSENSKKIAAEREWFRQLPDQLKIFAPVVLDSTAPGENDSYRIEYCYLATLSDLFVFGRLPGSVWRRIFERCDEFVRAAAQYRPGAIDFSLFPELYRDKTVERLEKFAADSSVDLDREWTINGETTPSLRRIVDEMATQIGLPDKSGVTLIHGDFCFSNILFDFRTQRIRVLDPRGLDARNAPTIYGDMRYDVAKLYHSAVGSYDHIIAGNCDVTRPSTYELELRLPDDARLRAIRELFVNMKYAGRFPSDLKAHQISILLFLSMLPLHADNWRRQFAFLANALRLYRVLPA